VKQKKPNRRKRMKLNTEPLSGIELRQTVVTAGPYYARISAVEIKPQVADPSRTNLIVEVTLDDPEVTNTKGEIVENKGIRLSRNISMHKTEKYDPGRRYKELAIAVGHPAATDDSVDFDDKDMLNQSVEVIIEVEEAEAGTSAKTGKKFDYPQRNQIKRFQKIKDLKYEAPPF
jgi:hypothetical protein